MNRPDQPPGRHRPVPGHQPARPTPGPAQGTGEGTGKLRVHRGHPPSRQPPTPPAPNAASSQPTRPEPTRSSSHCPHSEKLPIHVRRNNSTKEQPHECNNTISATSGGTDAQSDTGHSSEQFTFPGYPPDGADHVSEMTPKTPRPGIQRAGEPRGREFSKKPPSIFTR